MGILSSLFGKGVKEVTSHAPNAIDNIASHLDDVVPPGHFAPPYTGKPVYHNSAATRYLEGKKAGQESLLPQVGTSAQIRARVEDNLWQSRAVREEKALLKLRRGDIRIPNSDDEEIIWGTRAAMERERNPLSGGFHSERPVNMMPLEAQIGHNPIHRFDSNLEGQAWVGVLRSHLGNQYNSVLFPTLGVVRNQSQPLTAGPRGAVGKIKNMPVTFSGGQLTREEYRNFDSTLRSLIRDYPGAADTIGRIEVSGFNSIQESQNIFGERAAGLYWAKGQANIEPVINLHYQQTLRSASAKEGATLAYEGALPELRKLNPGFEESSREMKELQAISESLSRHEDAFIFERARETENFQYPISGMLNHEFGHAVQDTISPMVNSMLGIDSRLTDDVLDVFGVRRQVHDMADKVMGIKSRRTKVNLTGLDRKEMIDTAGATQVALSTGSEYASTNLVESFAETFRIMREGVDSPAIRNFDDMVTERSQGHLGSIAMRSGGDDGLEVPMAAIRETRNNPIKSGIGPRQGPEGRRRLQRVQPTFDRNAPSPKAGRDHAIREIGGLL